MNALITVLVKPLYGAWGIQYRHGKDNKYATWEQYIIPVERKEIKMETLTKSYHFAIVAF
jgi:hypothetical protein